MGDATNRLNVFPSRMVLATIKERIVAAKTGYSLLKRKSDAIKMKLHEILKEIVETKRRVVPSMRDASFSHTDAVYAAGEFNDRVIENVSRSSFRVKASIQNVAGVKLPIFSRVMDDFSGEDQNRSTFIIEKRSGLCILFFFCLYNVLYPLSFRYLLLLNLFLMQDAWSVKGWQRAWTMS